MSDQIHEQEAPGIGRRHSVLTCGGEVGIVIHDSGRRAIHLADSTGHAPPAVAYFQPTLTRQIEAFVGGLLIDWSLSAPTRRGPVALLARRLPARLFPTPPVPRKVSP